MRAAALPGLPLSLALVFHSGSCGLTGCSPSSAIRPASRTRSHTNCQVPWPCLDPQSWPLHVSAGVSIWPRPGFSQPQCLWVSLEFHGPAWLILSLPLALAQTSVYWSPTEASPQSSYRMYPQLQFLCILVAAVAQPQVPTRCSNTHRQVMGSSCTPSLQCLQAT